MALLRLSRAAVSFFSRTSISRKQLLPAAAHLISGSTTSTTTPAFAQPTLPFTSPSARFFSSRTRTFDPNVDEIGPDTILFEGCDYNHWLITIDFPKDQNLTREQMIEYYVNTAAQVFGSVEEAKKKIYALSTTTYQGFQVECSEETSEKFKNLPGVVFVLPDSYIDPVNKEYGGDKYINGEIIPRPPPVHYGRRSNNRDRRPREQQMPYDQQGNAPHNNNQNYGPPPQQNYGPPPRQNYGPPQQQNYGPPPPRQSHGPPPQQNYGPPPPQHNYSAPPPQQNYGPPPPQQNYGPPPPQRNYYGPPPPQQNYGPPPPQQNYGPPPPQQNYGPPTHQQNYGPPPPQKNYGPPPHHQQNGRPASGGADYEGGSFGQASGGHEGFPPSSGNK